MDFWDTDDDDYYEWLERVVKEAMAKQQGGDSGSRKLPPSVTAPLTHSQLPVISFTTGRTTYIGDYDGIAAAAVRVFMAATTVGFDMEWQVTFQTGAPPRPVALIQLCFDDPELPGAAGSRHHCLLLHISRCASGGLPPSLAAVLANPRIAKVGVGIHQDAHKIKTDFRVTMDGLVDLGGHANAHLADPAAGKLPQKWSLAALAERVLQGRLLKPQSVRCSDWERVPLAEGQVTYAATDAWVSLRLHQELEKLPVVWTPAPARPNRDMRPELAGRTPGEAVPAGAVPACPAPRALQPAKASALAAHLGGVGVVEIALQRGIQPATAMGYLAEAIAGGHAYGWGWLEGELPRGAVALAARFAAAALDPGGEEGPLATGMPPGEEAAAAAAAAYHPGDLLDRVLRERGQRLGELQAEAEAELPGLGFGELRLAFAHLARCNPAWKRQHWTGPPPQPPQ